MPRKPRRLLLALVVIFVLVMPAVLLLRTGGASPRPPLPNPNGYDDFVKAGARLTGDAANASALGPDGLRGLVSTNAESLRLLRLGLTRQCAVPMDALLTNTVQIGELNGMKRLTQLLAAEGRLWEMDNQPAAAAQSYIDVIHLGNEISRGGLVIHRLVGIACEAVGCQALARLAPRLGPKEARGVSTELEKVEASHVTWAEVARDESYFTRSQLRRSLNPIAWVVGWWQNRQMVAKVEPKHTTALARERLLALELALRAYQAEQGSLPARLDDLVPTYLSRVPQDPFTGQPLRFRPQGTNWLLYSVGPDRVDHGGRPAARGKGDILLDRL